MKERKTQKRIKGFLKVFGQNIRHIRQSQCISIAEASGAMDISAYVLNKLEEGRFPNIRLLFLLRLAEYYHKSLPELFEGI